jgi:hypothetical protein
MDNLEKSAEGSFEFMQFVYKNSYFVVLLILIISAFVYKFFANGLNLKEYENVFKLDTNFINSLNGYFRSLWLSDKLNNDTIIVDNNSKDGLLDKIVEKLENTDV